MISRRDFLRSAAALTGSAFVWGSIPEAVARAYGIDPELGSTWKDAEHVVILMQENRSFDHSYGAMRGVRGYRDPRVHRQPDGRPVWFQTDAEGRTYVPFRLDIKDTNVTWIGGLPHSWTDQVDARNGGKYDQWLICKARKDLPLTLGHYQREDIPFYYSLADCFTICDQAFCSSLTGTTPNRLFLWSGTIRRDAKDNPKVQNSEAVYDAEVGWTTFPERLEDAGVTWKVYQNDLYIESGFKGEEEEWLANFGDNRLEYFTQYRVRFAKNRRAWVQKRLAALPDEIVAASAKLDELQGEDKDKATKKLASLQNQLQSLKAEADEYNEETWNKLSSRDRALFEKAFADNSFDPDYRLLEELEYTEGDKTRKVKVPKSDVLAGFRRDVSSGNLPQVSYLVAPQAFSDHPSSAWYGAWYVSEVMKILTDDPEVWKKTIFILCYDENDGYFDHVPPFIAPHPDRPETGKASKEIDTTLDIANTYRRDHSIGLGFRCPLVVASPWNRGGNVNSEVFDHTSIIQFLETWLALKGKKVHESNISSWRRAICGDLTSTFKRFNGEHYELPTYQDRNKTIVGIHQARYKPAAKRADGLSTEEVETLDVGAAQEAGTRPACALGYDLSVNGEIVGGALELMFQARRDRLGRAAIGAPFNLYIYGDEMQARAYALVAGGELRDSIPVQERYHVKIDGPNGFLREFSGSGAAPSVHVEPGSDHLTVQIKAAQDQTVTVRDHSYGASPIQKSGNNLKIVVDVRKQNGWYDFSVEGPNFDYRYAGRLENGKWTITDPAMGGS